MSITGRFMKNYSMDNPACVVCGKQITMSYWVCADCAAHYGGSYKKYPEWLRDLIRMERRERYRSARDEENEAPLDDAHAYYVEEWDEDRFP